MSAYKTKPKSRKKTAETGGNEPFNQYAILTEVRKSAFWAAFVGWSCVLAVLALFVGALMMPSEKKVKPRPPVKLTTAENAAPLLGAESATGIAKQPPLPEPPPPQGKAEPEVPVIAKIFGGGYLVLLVIAGLALVGMVIMLVWFSQGVGKLAQKPTMARLQQVLVLQHRLWVCIGTFCLCSLLELTIIVIATVGFIVTAAGAASGGGDVGLP